MDPEEGGALAAARAPLVQESDPQSPGSPFSRLRAAADETRATATNAGSLINPLPARRWRRSRADVLPVDADGCTVSRAPIPIISHTLVAYLGLS